MEQWTASAQGLQAHRSHCDDPLENVEASTSHNPVGFTACYRGSFTFFTMGKYSNL
jgi:hypothetical protein